MTSDLMAVWQGKVRTSLDQYRQVIAALDTIDASEVVAGPLPQSPDLKFLTVETRALVERMRDAAEDMLFEDHARLGFESEKKGVADEVSPAPESSPAEVARNAREARHEALCNAVVASDEPTNVLAESLGLKVALVARIRRDAGDRCAYYRGSKLSPEQREEIAKTTEPTKAVAARLRVSEAFVTKTRKAGWVL